MRDIVQLLEQWQLDVGGYGNACTEHRHFGSGNGNSTRPALTLLIDNLESEGKIRQSGNREKNS